MHGYKPADVDLWRRRLARSLTWRASGIVLSGLIAWFLARDFVLGLELGLVYNFIRFFTFIGHDWLWDRFAPYWGRAHMQFTCPRCGYPEARLDAPNDVRVWRGPK